MTYTQPANANQTKKNNNKKMMGAVDKFLFKLENFDKENIPAKVIKALQPYLKVKYMERYCLFLCVCVKIGMAYGSGNGNGNSNGIAIHLPVSPLKLELIYEIEILHLYA